MKFSSEPVVHTAASPRDGDGGFPGEAQYRAIFEASRDALLVADARTGMLLDANPAAVTLLGRPLEKIRSMHQSDVHSHEDLDAGRDSFQKRRYRSGTTEHTLVRADGARIPVEISASPMRGPQGQEWVLGNFHDLTEHAEADQALRTSEARLRGITDSASDAIVMMNPKGEITFWNPAAELILGYQSDEAMGRNLHELLAPERYHAAFQQHFPSFLLSGQGPAIGRTLELTAQRKDGSEIAVDLSLSGVLMSGEWHAVGILRDITTRKEAAEALAASEKKFRQMAEHIREVFWIMPPSLDEFLSSNAGKDFYVSPAYEQVWGRTRESLYADPAAWLHSIHPEDVERTHALFNPLEPVDTEFRILTPEGQVKWIRDRAFPIRAQDGSLIRVTGIAEDITERKNYQSALILAREQAEAANRAKSMFLAATSHELRTPLNAILGFAELVSLDMADRGIHDWDEDLQKIRGAGNHLLSVISDVLDFSKIEADHIELAPETFDVQVLMNDVTASFDAIARKNEIDLQTECEPAALYLDRTRLGQCIFNLVGNACKFTHKGRVRVQGAWERNGDQEFYTIRVADTGIGIQPQDLEQLFQYFTQVDNSRKRKYGGTGLGLAISRRLARLMGGDITAESKFGNGSRFTLRIPKDPSPPAAETCSDESAG